ncbi:TPA: IS1 family transposase, partial [Escherichia coli]|nr:IS1 family transposase [Escherichia coli]
NGKSTAGHQRYLCSHCRKTWQGKAARNQQAIYAAN